MRLYYFVGGPTAGNEQAFVDRLRELGGPPTGWHVYPIADGSGQALHLVTVDAEDAIDAHLANFAPGYEHGPVIELEARSAPTPLNGRAAASASNS